MNADNVTGSNSPSCGREGSIHPPFYNLVIDCLGAVHVNEMLAPVRVGAALVYRTGYLIRQQKGNLHNNLTFQLLGDRAQLPIFLI